MFGGENQLHKNGRISVNFKAIVIISLFLETRDQACFNGTHYGHIAFKKLNSKLPSKMGNFTGFQNHTFIYAIEKMRKTPSSS